MGQRVARLLFPREHTPIRRRKMRNLCVTILGGLGASALVALTYVWVYHSGRF